MSAIGGLVDFKKGSVDFSALNNMRLSMSLRGKKRSAAFLCGGVGMFFNSSLDSSEDECEQPNIYERRGRSSALCIDSDYLDASAVSEKYFVHGTDFLGCLDGDFALSLYDEERDIVILARDKKGKKPLFYRIVDGKIFFASEPKGIVEAVGRPVGVKREILEFHLTAPMGIYRASNIYCDISEVLAGECVIFSKLGISKFFFREKRDVPRIVRKNSSRSGKEHIISFYPSFNISKLSEYLNEALIAFDYPQFDSLMPPFMELLEESGSHQKQFLKFEDGIKRKNVSYAREREDRLGNLYGVKATGVISRSQDLLIGESADLLENSLKERFFGLPHYKRALLRQIFGEYKLDCLLQVLEQQTKKEDTEKKIRILGMLCQTVEWMQVRELCFDAQERTYSYQRA